MSIDIVDKAMEILKRYPLCDRCLGRLFGYLGKGLGNDERGKALKLVLVMELHRKLQMNEIDLETMKLILLNAQREDFLKNLGEHIEDVERRRCYICGDLIDKWIEEYSQKIATIIQNLKPKSFLVGVSSVQEYVVKEDMIAREFGLGYRENIKRELKREIGKRAAALTGIKPDFSKPEVIVIIDIATGSVRIDYPSIILYGYYWKYGRMISQNIWITKSGKMKYPLSVEDIVKFVSQQLKADRYRLHIAGREDVDVRVYGSGRPIAIEFKTMDKNIDMELVEKYLNSVSSWLQFQIKMKVNRAFVIRLKEGARFSRKIYRAIVYTSTPITSESLQKLEEVFKDRVIEQRTPTRVLKRRKDKVRRRKMFKIKTFLISPNLFEALIECEGGLYIKELISGDNGRTKPSFSDVLGCDARCVMLDVLYVHEYI